MVAEQKPVESLELVLSQSVVILVDRTFLHALPFLHTWSAFVLHSQYQQHSLELCLLDNCGRLYHTIFLICRKFTAFYFGRFSCCILNHGSYTYGDGQFQKYVCIVILLKSQKTDAHKIYVLQYEVHLAAKAMNCTVYQKYCSILIIFANCFNITNHILTPSIAILKWESLATVVSDNDRNWCNRYVTLHVYLKWFSVISCSF